MAFRLFDKTIQNKVFAKPIGQVKAGRNRVAAVGQTEWSIVPKTPGEPFKISWTARNDDTIPGTVGLALIDGDGNSRAITAGVILQPGETKDLKLNYTVPEGQASDESIWTIAMIPLAWEDAPDPATPEFTNLAYGSPAHTFVVSYTDSKKKGGITEERWEYEATMKAAGFQPDGQIPFNENWRRNLQITVDEDRRVQADLDAYVAALNEWGVSTGDVPWKDGEWSDRLDAFIANRDKPLVVTAPKPTVDPDAQNKINWLAALGANGLTKDELSLAQFKSGMLTTVVNNRAAKKAEKEDMAAFLSAWGNLREEMGESGFAVPGPSYSGPGWASAFNATRAEYEDRRNYNQIFSLTLAQNPTITKYLDRKQPEYSPGWKNRLSGWTTTALRDAETTRVGADKVAWDNADKSGLNVPYSSNWRTALTNAKSKRISDQLRADAVKRQNEIRLQAELFKQRAKEAEVLKRARAAQRRQEIAEEWEDDNPTIVPTYSPRASTNIDVPRDVPLTVPDRSPASQEKSTENNRIEPVYVAPYVSPYIDHRTSPGGASRVVESSSGNFLTVFEHEATGDEGDWDDFI